MFKLEIFEFSQLFSFVESTQLQANAFLSGPLGVIMSVFKVFNVSLIFTCPCVCEDFINDGKSSDQQTHVGEAGL